MIEEVVKGALTALVSQGGGWLLAALFLVGIWYLDRRNTALQKTCDQTRDSAEVELKDQFDKRLAEFRLILEALNRSSEAIATMRVSVDARTEAINQLTAGFAELVRDLENNRERWAEKGEQWSKQIEDIARRLEDLQRGRLP